MTEKNKTISFRVNEDKFEDLRKIAEDEDVSLSDLMRGRADNILEVYEIADETESSASELFDSHVDSLVDDRDYRILVDQFYQDERNFEKFVQEEDYFDTKWVDETEVDYDLMLEKFQDVVADAQRREFEVAYSKIDKLKEEGCEQEAFLLDTVVEKYHE